jgi:hypothetical protein
LSSNEKFEGVPNLVQGTSQLLQRLFITLAGMFYIFASGWRHIVWRPSFIIFSSFPHLSK